MSGQPGRFLAQGVGFLLVAGVLGFLLVYTLGSR
jgi:hypothetical protein